MLASRHHRRCRKFVQVSRDTSTLKASSNQKGLQGRQMRRRAMHVAVRRTSVMREIQARDFGTAKGRVEPLAAVCNDMLWREVVVTTLCGNCPNAGEALSTSLRAAPRHIERLRYNMRS